MTTAANVFSVTGNKIASLVFAENSLRFSSNRFELKDAFDEAWAKKLSLATKTEIKYTAIKSVSKEKPGKDITIRYKALAGLPSECVFSFDNEIDNETFFNFLEKEQYFRRTEETLSPMKASSGYLAGLIFTVAMTIFCHYQAIELSTPEGLAKANEQARNGKTKLFNIVIAHLGVTGVWAIGALIAGYIIYKIYLRFTNPPNRIRFVPQNQ